MYQIINTYESRTAPKKIYYKFNIDKTHLPDADTGLIGNPEK